MGRIAVGATVAAAVDITITVLQCAVADTTVAAPDTVVTAVDIVTSSATVLYR